MQFTGDLLFKDLWLRPDLAPRDRNVVTMTSLIANGKTGQLAFHLNAMDNGLTAEQAGEVMAQIAFHAGWPHAYASVGVLGDVLKNRAR